MNRTRKHARQDMHCFGQRLICISEHYIVFRLSNLVLQLFMETAISIINSEMAHKHIAGPWIHEQNHQY